MSADILAEARRLLSESCYSDVSRLTCDDEGGRLVIVGTVGSYYTKQMAQEAVRHLGVRIVNRAEVGRSKKTS